MIYIQDLSYSIAGRTLLDKVSITIPTGQRVGLVGPNGAGKSTLFKLISGELAPDGGEISLGKGATLGMVSQDLPDDGTSLLDIVLAADTERAALLQEADTAHDPDRIGDIHDRLNEIGAYDAPSRAAVILSGLGFSEAAQALPLSAFSGGWRARVALAAALFRQPDVLLLDEPTNHLDFESMIWLENFLIRYRETLVIISHDRDILNKTVNNIIHLENQKLVFYTGNYDQFEHRRCERLMNQQALYEKQQAQKAQMMKFVTRFGAKATKAKQAQSRLKAIERMDFVDAVMADRVTAFTFPEPDELNSPLITLEEVAAGYSPGNPVLRALNLRVDMGDRIALLGANGNGKSTLVKILSARLAPLAGEIHKSGKLKVGYFAQFQTDELDVRYTPFDIMREAMKGASESRIRSTLSSFGFDKLKADTCVGEISGGEKARLLFCRMSFHAPQIMLLDEPTNHLDIDAREALVRALNNYSGAVILVSHDPHLVECVADQLWLVAEGKCTPFDDDLDGYRKLVTRQRRMDQDKAKGKSDKGGSDRDKQGKPDLARPDQTQPDDALGDPGHRQEKQRSSNPAPGKAAPGKPTSGKPTPGKPTSGKPKGKALEKEALRIEQEIAALTARQQALEAEISACYGKAAEAERLKELNRSYKALHQELTTAGSTLDLLIADL
jgi:ATP-binding cassette subfamily F protein 3